MTPPGSRVMVVDDEPDVLLLSRVILEGAGWRVSEAASGEDALKLLGDGERPDVLLLDIRMPGLDGWDVLGHLNEHGCRMPVVMFSAHTESGAERRAINEGCRAYLRKPFSPNELIDTVEQAVA
jgi:CheY-like chemotaxis protein